MRILFYRTIRTAVFIIITAAVFSCNNSRPNRDTLWTAGFIEKAPHTIVLNEDAMGALDAVGDDGTFVFNARPSQLENAVSGDVMVVGPCKAAPDGALRKIDSIVRSDGSMVVLTSPSTLEEAISDCDASMRAQYDNQRIGRFAPLKNGVALQQAAAKPNDGLVWKPSPIVIKMDNTILFDADGNPDTAYDQISASGQLTVSPEFEFDIKISNFKLEQALIKNKTTEVADFRIKNGDMNKSAYNFNLSTNVAQIYFTPIVFFISGFPVVITPSLTVKVGLNGDIRYEISAGIRQQATLELGAQYANGEWRPIKNFTNTVSLDAPSLRADAKFQAYMTPRFELALYGVAGAYVDVKGYLELDVKGYADHVIDFTTDIPDFQKPDWKFLGSINGSLSWGIYAGVSSHIGVFIRVLSFDLFDYNYEIFNYKWTLHEGSISGTAGYNENGITRTAASVNP